MLGVKTLKKTPEVIEAINSLMEMETAGDPMTELKWTHRTTEKIADQLRALDIFISANTVAKLLKEMKFSLRVNSKKIPSQQHPDRDEQFQYIQTPGTL